MEMNILSLFFISLALNSANASSEDKLKINLNTHIESELKDYMETDSENYMQNEMEKSTEYELANSVYINSDTDAIERDMYANYENVTELKVPEERTTGPTWPKGSWGLPSTRRGCPSSDGFTWHKGWRHHDGADDFNKNEFSVHSHFQSPGNEIKQHFCIKESGGRGNWPAGQYCIYRKGGNCPDGFNTGSIYWDDEDAFNDNSKSGYLPDGVYDRNTKIYYCCRNDGNPYDAISLPTDISFYLLRQEHTCQRVEDMQLQNEWIFFDNEDINNKDSTWASHPSEDGGPRDHRLHYCFYHRYWQ